MKTIPKLSQNYPEHFCDGCSVYFVQHVPELNTHLPKLHRVSMHASGDVIVASRFVVQLQRIDHTICWQRVSFSRQNNFAIYSLPVRNCCDGLFRRSRWQRGGGSGYAGGRPTQHMFLHVVTNICFPLRGCQTQHMFSSNTCCDVHL